MTGESLSRALRWPLWSWRNLTVTTVLALVVLAALGRLTDGPARAMVNPASRPDQPHATVPAPQTPSSQQPTPAAPLPSASPSSQAPPANPADARSPVKAATAFVTAWAHTTVGQNAWLAGMKPWATASLLTSLAGTDPAQVPASRVTGDATLRTTKGSTATVSVPTDGGRVTVELVHDAGTWKATSLAPDDAPPGAPTPSLGPATPIPHG